MTAQYYEAAGLGIYVKFWSGRGACSSRLEVEDRAVAR
jgi:hypothetical protein